MSESRRKYGEADKIYLVSQVDGKCPLCGVQLFYTKGTRTHKAYELAHIYPLRPSKQEIEELKNEVRLHDDVNHPDNLIPLCLSCHGKFDKPRTAKEYRELAKKKQECIRWSKQQEIQSSYHIESEIKRVIDRLYELNISDDIASIEYDPKRLESKLDQSMSTLSRQKIKNNVADYFQYIKSVLAEVDRENPNASELICAQVKAYYIKQKSLGLDQQDIYGNIVNWIYAKTNPRTIDSSEIVTSFFIQNCEVF